MHFFLTLDSRAGVVARVDDLGAQTLSHGLLAALAGELDQPAQGQSLTALRADLDRDLIGRAANAAGLNLQARQNVLHAGGEHFHRVLARLVSEHVERVIADGLRDAALAVEHDLIDQLGNDGVAVYRIRQHFALGYKTTSWHGFNLLSCQEAKISFRFGFLAA